MRSMKLLLALAAAVVVGGCHSPGNWRNVEEAPHQWKLPPPGYEHVVHGPMTFEEIPDDTDQMIAAGWELVDHEPCDPDFPTRYLVVYRKHK